MIARTTKARPDPGESAIAPPAAPTGPVLSVDAQLSAPGVAVQLQTLDIHDEIDTHLRERDVYRLDLCLGARASRARLCFSDHWPPHRFEEPGSIFLLPPGEIVRIRSGAGRQKLIICRLQAGHVTDWLDGDLAWTRPPWTRPRIDASFDVGSLRVKTLLLRLAREASNPGFASGVLAEAIGVQIAIELERYYRNVTAQAGKGGLPAWRRALIHDRLRAPPPPGLAELASLCQLSVRQLARGFRASEGISIGRFVAEARLDHAKRLLAKGATVESVALTVGFRSVTSFCFAFRTSTGVTPGEYKRDVCGLSVAYGAVQ